MYLLLMFALLMFALLMFALLMLSLFTHLENQFYTLKSMAKTKIYISKATLSVSG